jgi:hypothetical protein
MPSCGLQEGQGMISLRSHTLRGIAAVSLALAPGFCAAARAEAPLELDHVWIFVRPGAPERRGLGRCG